MCVRSILEIPLIKKQNYTFVSHAISFFIYQTKAISSSFMFFVFYFFTDHMVILFSKIWLTSDTVTGDAVEGKLQTSQSVSLTT